MSRLRYGPSRDANDGIVRAAIQILEGSVTSYTVEMVDTSPFRNLIDRVCAIGDFMFGLEVKVSHKHKLTKGEQEFPGVVFIVTTIEEVLQAFDIAHQISKQIDVRSIPSGLRPLTTKEV